MVDMANCRTQEPWQSIFPRAEPIRITIESPGIFTEFGTFAPETIVTEEGLANLFGKCPESIQRAVERGELPPGVRLMGKPTWTIGAIVRHLENRLAAEACDFEQTQRRISNLKP